jgi:hypothetical protein
VEVLFSLVAVVVVLVPISIRAPAVFVFVPPPMLFAPATLARLMQLPPFVVGLPAMASVALNRLVQFVFGVFNATLAAVHIFCVQARRNAEKHSCR